MQLAGVSTQHIIYAGFALICAGIASFHDLRERRIPNMLTAPAAAAGLILHLSCGGWSEAGSAAAAALLAGAGFFLIFAAGGMGAGDVKLIGAVAAINALPRLDRLVLAILISGGVLAVICAARRGRLRLTLQNALELTAHHLRRGLVPHPEFNVGNDRGLGLPFAVPVAAGCAIHLGLLLADVRL